MEEKQETRQLWFGEQFVAEGRVYYRGQDASQLEQACMEALDRRPKTGAGYYIICGDKTKLILPGHNAKKLAEALSNE